MAKISVIVPVYNAEKYLFRCIDSILAQSFSDFDLVLVDDGSPDKCPEICDQYARRDSRIHVIHQDNKGVSAARNTGLEWALTKSDSQWLAFVDSDDWVHPDYLKRLFDTCKSMDVNIAMCDSLSVDTFKPYFQIGNPLIEKKNVREIYRVGSGSLNLVSLWAKLFLKSQWKDIRFPLGKISEDRATTYKLIFQNDSIGILHSQLYYYFYNPESLVHKKWTPNRLDDLESIHEQMEFFKERDLTEAWEYAAVSRLFCLKTSIEDLNRIKPKYRNYYWKLQVELHRSIHLYHKKFLSVKGNEWIYERVSPRFMKCYWYFIALRRKFGYQ